MGFTIDIEPTNRCNAKCHFCPRDQTPHQGLMSPDVFDQALRRAEEYRQVSLDLLGVPVGISLCGLGEPLLNRHTPSFVRQAVDAGFEVTLSSNGSLLTEERGRTLLDAGLENIFINVGDEGEEYEDVYRLPFERTRDNVVAFAELAGERCKVHIVLVDYRRDPAHVKRMEDYWSEHGVHRFVHYDIINRGGSLFVDHMQFEAYPELEQARGLLQRQGGEALCGAPLAYLFIGYDGQYYLCCSDWKKETPMGSVFDESFRSVTSKKLQYVASREPVCKTCNLDPLNHLTEELRAISDGQRDPATIDELVASVASGNATVHDISGKLGVEVPAVALSGPSRRLIPVRID